jgi:probable phosphoglycerate mutase
MPVLYLIRHGQTGWNAERRLQGQADTDINALGHEQADRNGRRLAELIGRGDGYDFVASPLRRTCETMERVRIAMGLPAAGYRTDPRLKELHFGDWQGHTFAELERIDPGLSARRDADKWTFRPPGDAAETYAMLVERIRPWLEAIAAPTVCVTHGGVIRAALHIRMGLSGEEAAMLDVPQDRFLKFENGSADWI